MKKITLALLLLLALYSCHTARIDGGNFKISSSTTALGTIGVASLKSNSKNEFLTKAIPVLEQKIRLDVKILPLNKKLTGIYADKASTDQTLPPLIYNDSLALKPEYVVITLYDTNSYTGELNSTKNSEVYTLIKDTQEISIVSAVAVVFPGPILEQLREADTYYLMCSADQKYTLSLYNQGKQSARIDIGSATTLAYFLSKPCWAENERDQWYIADLVPSSHSCLGLSKEKIKEKEENNLFKM